jgi:hypothetical protein
MNGKEKKFAVECKWRSNYFKNEIVWAKQYQINTYRAFAERENIPVFLILGVGNTPGNPIDVYIVPLSELRGEVVTKSELYPYKRKDNNKKFFFDYESERLL